MLNELWRVIRRHIMVKLAGESTVMLNVCVANEGVFLQGGNPVLGNVVISIIPPRPPESVPSEWSNN